MTILSDYITQTRRLLHDGSGQFWTDTELTDYINAGRNAVVSDTGCNRILQSYSLVASQEAYPYTLLPQGASTIDVINVTILWGTQRVPLDYMAFTEFNAKLRGWQTFVSRPTVFTTYGNQSVMIGPVPDQIYPAEFDTVVLPFQMTLGSTTADTLVYPYTDPVAYYAASQAKEKTQEMGEAEAFMNLYKQKAYRALKTSFTRRLRSATTG